jgi:hypothetical protein
MIKIKNKYLNSNKVISLEFATSDKNNKNYIIINVDTVNLENCKIFIEVTGEQEFKEIVEQVKNQINK